jgi:hypothetical protein
MTKYPKKYQDTGRYLRSLGKEAKLTLADTLEYDLDSPTVEELREMQDKIEDEMFNKVVCNSWGIQISEVSNQDEVNIDNPYHYRIEVVCYRELNAPTLQRFINLGIKAAQAEDAKE